MEKKTVNIYGYKVDVEYSNNDGVVEIHKTLVKDATYPVALSSLDIISEAKEIIEAELLESEDLESEEIFVNNNKEKPF